MSPSPFVVLEHEPARKGGEDDTFQRFVHYVVDEKDGARLVARVWYLSREEFEALGRPSEVRLQVSVIDHDPAEEARAAGYALGHEDGLKAARRERPRVLGQAAYFGEPIEGSSIGTRLDPETVARLQASGRWAG